MDNKPINPNTGIDWEVVAEKIESGAFLVFRIGVVGLGVLGVLRCADIV